MYPPYPIYYQDTFSDSQAEHSESYVEDLIARIAAEEFPLNDGKPWKEDAQCWENSALSPFPASSRSSSTMSPHSSYTDGGNESGLDSNPDPEPMPPDISSSELDDAKSQYGAGEDGVLPFPSTWQSSFVASSTGSNGVEKQPPTRRAAATRRFASDHSPSSIQSTPARRFARGISHSSVFSVESDHDADDESENDSTDDEYVPSPTLGPRKYRRFSPLASSRRYTTLPTAHHVLPGESAKKPVKRARLPPPSRNKQATSTTAICLAVSSSSTKTTFICPECGWKQMNQRMPDFKRHLRTHTRPSDEDQEEGWWCNGVLLEEAPKYNISSSAVPYLFLNRPMIGGCMRTFSRRDALKRHLDNINATCVGSSCAVTKK